jgi:hypothetical protein
VRSGPVFRAVALGGRVFNTALSADSVPRIVKKFARRIDLDPAAFGAHSLRSGFVTSAVEATCTGGILRRSRATTGLIGCAPPRGTSLFSAQPSSRI